MTFETMLALSNAWYAGRMSPEWRGRSAQETQAILESVGLVGEFWRVV